MTLVAAAFVLDMMEQAQPSAAVPWKDSYSSTAESIAYAANNHPLFAGETGPAETAAIMVGVAVMESHLDPKAKGDCDKKLPNGMCAPGGIPKSFCAFQVHQSNFRDLGVTKEILLEDINACTSAALTLMHTSFRTCKGWKAEDRLNQYATGGGFCVRPTHDEGAHRMRRGTWLYRWKIAKDKRVASES